MSSRILNSSSRRPRRMGRAPSFQPYAPFRRTETRRQHPAILPCGNPTACSLRPRDDARRFATDLRRTEAYSLRQTGLSRILSRHPTWLEHRGSLEDRRQRCPCWWPRRPRWLPHFPNHPRLGQHCPRSLPDRRFPFRLRRPGQSRRCPRPRHQNLDRRFPFRLRRPGRLRCYPRPRHQNLDRLVHRVRSRLTAWRCRNKPKTRVR